ncbi:BZ3500_MvSof-1268-A1-R1_Chr11-1g03155 [Microbotryum saponariae]|uniref:BZ3500_MvSof-1268-A1-R1_Chr11-1g03155 protein n=1 Tax=Microbotryum saponariae TaxID=289078 RepID=A0A2X0M3P9_9BASI|nr:BZ3501_MvSof-1269-A2-R1_Chr11g02730 [Microbotryum saponariae]SDA03715.1 BZ3500_MvSof-1268-A1-R1_Chr11-1g03155 [Microbotryum saponariae]
MSDTEISSKSGRTANFGCMCKRLFRPTWLGGSLYWCRVTFHPKRRHLLKYQKLAPRQNR